MIRLGYNQQNRVALNLSEAVTLTGSPVYFLFRFVSDSTNDEKIFVAPDLSTNILRYNRFNIIVTAGTENLTASTINLNPKGEYIFTCYEQYSPTNLSLTGTSGVILKQGIVQLTGSSMTYYDGSYTGQTETYSYYQP